MEALAGGSLIGMTVDESDAAMAQLQQVAGHGARSFEIVDADGAKVRRRFSRRHQHGRDAGLSHGLQRFLGIAEGRRQDHAVDAALDQPPYRFGFGFRAFAFFNHQLAAARAGLFQTAQQEFAEIVGAGIGIENTDMDGVGAGQAARRLVRLVTQRRDRRRHPHPGFFPHIAFAIDHPRHRHG